MTKRTNYYNNLSADYSKPRLISDELRVGLLSNGEKYISLYEQKLPEITSEYSLAQIEQENREWWPSHCEALRQGRGDLLAGEYANSLVYFCADGPFYSKTVAVNREVHWWAILAQPGVTMAWPIVMFNGEVVYSEWNCTDDITKEIIAKGNQTFLRRGHRGACYFKSEQLNFYRDVYASDELLHWIRR
ncbi:MAG: hypothetical protein KME46_34910 [Brasilonema angustatum HA4187-MV1]|jgi:hypothetical protein|nr:hypothetical protein [Brasilonema angustatum HA4187-MV1]